MSSVEVQGGPQGIQPGKNVTTLFFVAVKLPHSPNIFTNTLLYLPLFGCGCGDEDRRKLKWSRPRCHQMVEWSRWWMDPGILLDSSGSMMPPPEADGARGHRDGSYGTKGCPRVVLVLVQVIVLLRVLSSSS